MWIAILGREAEVVEEGGVDEEHVEEGEGEGPGAPAHGRAVEQVQHQHQRRYTHHQEQHRLQALSQMLVLLPAVYTVYIGWVIFGDSSFS